MGRQPGGPTRLASTRMSDFDERLAERLRAFQTKHGLPATGVATQQTWAVLAAPAGYGGNTRQGNYWHDEDTVHHASDDPISVLDPGQEVVAAGSRFTIYEDEIRVDGSITWRGRNPGAIGNGEPFGAYPGKKASAMKKGDLISVAVFPDESTGFEATKKVILGYAGKTLLQMMKKYAPLGHGDNDPAAYAASLAKALGITTSTLVETLTDDQVTSLAEEIKTREGWIPGKVRALTDPTLPAAVKKLIRVR